VNIPGRGNLYALVNSDLQAMYPENIFGNLRRPSPKKVQSYDRVDDIHHIKTMIGATGDLQCIDPPWIGLSCPKMVRFRDSHDPKTIEVVDPADLSKSFGYGIKISRVFVEITDAHITEKVEKYLPSFGPETGFDSWYRSLSFGDPRQISKRDFKRDH